MNKNGDGIRMKMLKICQNVCRAVLSRNKSLTFQRVLILEHVLRALLNFS